MVHSPCRLPLSLYYQSCFVDAVIVCFRSSCCVVIGQHNDHPKSSHRQLRQWKRPRRRGFGCAASETIWWPRAKTPSCWWMPPGKGLGWAGQLVRQAVSTSLGLTVGDNELQFTYPRIFFWRACYIFALSIPGLFEIVDGFLRCQEHLFAVRAPFSAIDFGL